MVSMIEQYGLNTPKTILAASLDEALNAAEKIGYPVALKINSPSILHKTDIGGVDIGIKDSSGVEEAYQKILSNVKEKFPKSEINGVDVQEMVEGGFELIIGLIKDPQFGLAIMFGLGGIFTELFKDVTFRILPITEADARMMIHDIQGFPILNGFRGAKPVSENMLVDLLMKVSRMGQDYSDKLEAVDLNPVLVWENQHRVLDAKIIFSDSTETPNRNPEPNIKYLDKFFTANSIALIGASNIKGKVGNGVLDSLVNEAYTGSIFPVNPTHSEVMGLKAYPSISAIPEPVDMAIMTTNIKLVPEILLECKEKNCHNLVIISGGGKELGGDSISLEDTIRKLSKEHGIRIIGPNCTGVFDGKSRIATFFQTKDRMARPKDGQVCIMTQSGTVGVALLEDASAFGVHQYVSYGNRVDVDEADLLSYWGASPDVRVITMYVEGFEDGKKFLRAAKEVSSKKPIIIYKSARTEFGAKASASHTGNLGGNNKIIKSALNQVGMITVDSYDELLAGTKVLAMQPEANGNRVGMISNGAGSMIQAIDVLYEMGLSLPNLSPKTISIIQKQYPSYYISHNPIDITGSGTSDDYIIGIQAMLEDPNIDIVMAWFVFVNIPLDEDIIQKLGALNKKNYKKPMIVGSFGGDFSSRMASAIESEGIPVYRSVVDWAAAARVISWRSKNKRK